MKKTEISAGGGLSTGTRIGFGVGDFGANLIFQSTFIFLIFFFTDVFGIAAPVAGTIFLIAKAWDGVSDPIVGYLSDRTRTRWGKKRPYLLFGAIPLGVFFLPPVRVAAHTPGIQGRLWTGLFPLGMQLLRHR